jgi:hypothetical protein
MNVIREIEKSWPFVAGGLFLGYFAPELLGRGAEFHIPLKEFSGSSAWTPDMFDRQAFTGADFSIGGHKFLGLLDSGSQFPSIDPATADLIYLKQHSTPSPDKPDTDVDDQNCYPSIRKATRRARC